MRTKAQSRQSRQAFRDLATAECVLHAAIQGLTALGAEDFTTGLIQERRRLLAKLEMLQGDVYAVISKSMARPDERAQCGVVVPFPLTKRRRR